MFGAISIVLSFRAICNMALSAQGVGAVGKMSDVRAGESSSNAGRHHESLNGMCTLDDAYAKMYCLSRSLPLSLEYV
jgi:hypothetical protein